MNTLTKRIATVAATTVVLAGTFAAPAFADEAQWTCAKGARSFVSDSIGYVIHGGECSGSGLGPGLVTIPSGTYHCTGIGFNSKIGLLNAAGC
ncbi:hypothetical protein ACQP1V_43455 (plasmid) [Microtetraspora malaysiensis]|uniref:hypothetical protein n=1 Tax=Microtetraspora malaysiensis TaxID=161358 RepID=UPI003D92DF4A